MRLIKSVKLIVGLLAVVICVSVGECKVSWSDFSYGDMVLMGGIWENHKSSTLVASNILTYRGDWLNLGEIEPSWLLGIEDYQNVEYDTGDGIVLFTGISINAKKLGEGLPVVSLLCDLIPVWTYFGIGYSGTFQDGNWRFTEKVFACVKVVIK